jgi:hypothetical protein
MKKKIQIIALTEKIVRLTGRVRVTGVYSGLKDLPVR